MDERMSIDESRTRSLSPPVAYPRIETGPARSAEPIAEPLSVSDVYDTYSGRCWSLAKHIVGSDVLARTVIHDVFMEFSCDPVRNDPDSVSEWLTTRTHHVAAAAIRRDRATLEAGPDGVTILAPDRRALLAWGDLAPDLVERLNAVPAQQLRALLLAYLGGYTVGQIARQTRTTVDEVKQQMSLGLQALRATA